MSPPTPSADVAPKSPPLAFERTPNDSLVPPTQQPRPNAAERHDSPSDMGRTSPLSPATVDESSLYALVNKQRDTIDGLHKAFEEERKAWKLEQAWLNSRIARLETLLKHGHHWR